MGYLPDNTWVVVGGGEALAQAATHPLVLWSGLPKPEYKIAPEWNSVLLPRIHEISNILRLKGGGGGAQQGSTRTSRKDIARGTVSYNTTTITPATIKGTDSSTENGSVYDEVAATLLAHLPVRVQGDKIAIRVTFPAAHDPQPQVEGHPDYQAHAERIRRVLREQQGCHAGAAAAQEWQPLLNEFVRSSSSGGGGGSGSSSASIEVHSSGRSSAVVLSPPQHVDQVLEWLSHRPAVRWIAPLPRTVLRNRQASTITQSNLPLLPKNTGDSNLDPSLHPVWAAGIQGQNQVIGQGDSGLDHLHCFFNDPSVDWQANIKIEGRVRTFDSTVHRKIRLYRAFADFLDANGHGTHTAGTLAGIPLGTDISTDSTDFIGMAPSAKIAFIDLSSAADGDAILTPYNLVSDYFPYTTAVGAHVHSDSWGSTSVTYDNEASQVDEYCWKNPTFLPVFPAGNDGDKTSAGGLPGETTVNSPATSKNCIAAGATQTSSETAVQGSFADKVWTARAQLGPNLPMTFRVLQSDFSESFSTLGAQEYGLVAANPLQACTPITNTADLQGKIALIERGTCTYVQKAQAAQAAGAVAALVFDDEVGAYFVATSGTNGVQGLLPTATMPRRLGQNLMAVVGTGKPVNISFSAAAEPQYGFENLASFSSQGPVGRDQRVKPDLVAPGTLTSADASSGDQCGVVTYGGTSMATPVIAGSAILVRQYFQDGFYPSGLPNAPDGFEPTSALIKAVLVAGATSLSGYEADTGLPVDPPPSFRQGFGRVFLGASLFLQNNPYSPARLAVVDTVPINSGDVHQYCITAGGGPLSITLVWTDYPGEPDAAQSLVNDLDLVVRAEGLNGQALLGNGGDVDNSTTPDSVNNIEQVTLPAMPAGRLAVEVRGSSVQSFAGPQPYALVVNGDFSGTLTKPGADANNGACAVVVASITSGPSGFTNQQSVTFNLGTTSGQTKGVTFECRLGDGKNLVGAAGTTDWTACPSPMTYSNLPDGTYTFSVRASGETIDSSVVFTKDTTPPVVTVQANVPSSTTAGAVSLAFNGSDTTAVSYQCTVSVSNTSSQQSTVVAGSAVAAPIQINQPFNCTSPQTVAWLFPGQWTFQVTGADAAGNVAAPVTASWAVGLDPTINYARITTGPVLKIPKQDVAFTLVVVGPGAGTVAGTECALASGKFSIPSSWAACPNGSVSYGQPVDGDYVFAARVVGDTSVAVEGAPLPPTWATSSFTVDSTPPSITQTNGPTQGSAIDQTSVTFEFTLSEEDAKTNCSLSSVDNATDAIPPKPCISPVQLVQLSQGRYTFTATPSDAVGNVGTPLTVDFVVDTTPPNVTASAQVVNNNAVVVTFSATDAQAGSGVRNVTCRVRPIVLAPTSQGKVNQQDAQYNWQPCTSPHTFTGVVEGHWGVSVMAYDDAGTPSAPLELDVWVDTVAPVANITSSPSLTDVNPGGTVVFGLVDDTDRAAPGAGSPVQWQGLLLKGDGSSSGSGSGSDSGSGGTTTPPVSTSSTSTTKMYIPEAIRTDNASTSTPTPQEVVELGMKNVGVWSNCSASDCTYSGLKGGTYSFQARGVDVSGNVGDPTTPPLTFTVEGASGGMPTWELVAIIAGSVVGGVLVCLVLWQCCCRSRRGSSGTLNTAMISSSGTTSPPPPPGYYGNGIGGAGPPPPYLTGNGYHPPNGTANGYHGSTVNGYAANVNGSAYLTTPTNMNTRVVPQDPIEAQELALALAASEREAQRQRQPAVATATDEQLEAAMKASLEEDERRKRAEREDAELRAAIEASLAEEERKRRLQEQQWWAPSAPVPSATGSVYSSNPNPYAAEEWPPRR